jgi:hypothetical protein
MVLEVRAASRKTPGDGRFEISDDTARRLAPLGEWLEVHLDDAAGRASIERLPCTCSKGGSAGAHEHVFLASELFRGMTAERMYAVELDGRALRVVAANHAAR